MTYFGFLFRFLIIPILLFLAITLWDNRKEKQIPGFRNGRAVWIAIGIHVVLAVVYTTPWDNHLVATGVWYYNPDLVTGIIIGYVPIEEYTFFLVETILSGLWWWFLARRISPPPMGEGLGRDSRQTSSLFTCLRVHLFPLGRSSPISSSSADQNGPTCPSPSSGHCLRFFPNFCLVPIFYGTIASW